MNATQNKVLKTEQVTCPRCGGKGHFVEYSGIWGGTCFKCEGLGTVTVKVVSEAVKARRAAKLAEKQAAEAEAKAIHAANWNRKLNAAVEMYKNDRRLRVGPDHSWFHIHCQELAQKDRVWETL